MTAKTRATLKTDADTALNDNSAGEVTPADERTLIKDILDSAFIQETWEDIASAATCAIGGTSSNSVNITGTTGITSFGTIGAGIYRRLKFAGALLLTHNATSLILNGANITTAAGDTAEVVSEGSGNWRLLSYRRASATVDSYYPGGADVAVADGGTGADTAAGAQTNLGLTSGTWTPTLTNVTNIAAKGSPSGFYSRVGNIVTFSVRFTLDPISAGATALRISPPIPSAFSSSTDVKGSASTLTESGYFIADSTNDEIELNFTAVSTANQVWIGSGQYMVQ